MPQLPTAPLPIGEDLSGCLAATVALLNTRLTSHDAADCTAAAAIDVATPTLQHQTPPAAATPTTTPLNTPRKKRAPPTESDFAAYRALPPREYKCRPPPIVVMQKPW